VLLLHGWTLSADEQWALTYPAVAAVGAAIAPDHPGHGHSTPLRDRFALAHAADRSARLLVELGCPPATVVGYSMGGPIAVLLALRHPKLVSGLVLCATGARFDGPGQATARTVARVAAAILPTRAGRWLRRAELQRLVTRHPELAPWRAALAAGRAGLDPSTVVQALAALQGTDLRSEVHRLEVPAAVVVTEHDRLVAVERQRELATLIRGSTHLVAAPHLASITHHHAFNAALVEALTAVRASPNPSDP
jgi:pimeloyl-ACP methyl ester carboxylesterase